jgi:hypothetical protein
MILKYELTVLILVCIFGSYKSSLIKDNISLKKTKTCPDPYDKCNLGKEGMINVHIVPHTHDDVG